MSSFALHRPASGARGAAFLACAILLLLGLAGCAATKHEPFAIGLIADCQYADADTAGVREYRLAPEKLAACVDDLNERELAFVVHLGDFTDRDWSSFDVVAPIFERLRAPHHHVLGNHDFAVADEHKANVPARMGMPNRWWSFRERGWRFLVLDGNDISLGAHPKGSPRDAASRAWHAEHAPNQPEWGGALGDEQLAWLDRELAAADAAHERAILFCHYPLRPASGHELWNADSVLALVASHPSTAAWINGHNHDGAYAEERGIHCVTIRGMLDGRENAYAVLRVLPDRLELVGAGRQPSSTLPLRAR
ncbi:MAG: metallophosphoesterase [Planctomycetes bacterium]|nr:metallophosphoesterase [Planctomycetota bacterium]